MEQRKLHSGSAISTNTQSTITIRKKTPVNLYRNLIKNLQQQQTTINQYLQNYKWRLFASMQQPLNNEI